MNRLIGAPIPTKEDFTLVRLIIELLFINLLFAGEWVLAINRGIHNE
jgi:hypothetical protein